MVELVGAEKFIDIAPLMGSHAVSFFPRGDSGKLLKASCLCVQSMAHRACTLGML